jgi:hypothetical protein
VFASGCWHFEAAPDELRSLHRVVGGIFYSIGASALVNSDAIDQLQQKTSMSNILDTLNIGWVGVLIGVLCSMLGIAIGHHLQKKSEKKIGPSYLIDDVHIIGISENKLPSEIKITWRNQ